MVGHHHHILEVVDLCLDALQHSGDAVPLPDHNYGEDAGTPWGIGRSRHRSPIVDREALEGNNPRRSRAVRMTPEVVLLSGGVGGARLARGFEHLPGIDTTVVVNVGDDDTLYGLSVSPDLDTVLYTLAGVEGAHGWGRAGDTMVLMEHLSALGVDTRFRLGDADAALNLYRTMRLGAGGPLHEITSALAETLGIRSRILPATNDVLRTEVRIGPDQWIAFQEYFVLRGHRDEVLGLRFTGSDRAGAAPGVVEAIRAADAVIITPSNPPLSIWPILAVTDIAEAVGQATRVMAVSPLFGGRALKGPADRVMASLGLPPGNVGVQAAYDGLLHDLFIDTDDREDRAELAALGIAVHVGPTRIAQKEQAIAFAGGLLELL